ncbi:MAG: galactose mutarotase, partial [Clostridia bacterium]|nr:galactose mutarotase [Clostridia bacterium]
MTSIVSREFGKTKDGQKVTAFHLSNGNGMDVEILDFGGTVQTMTVPDKNGKPVDIVLGYDDVASYEEGTCFYGAIVGRYANRIGGARYVLEGKEYILQKNNGEDNHVHGVFNKRMFNASVEGETLVLKYFSPDMEEGYPGNFSLEVRYSLSEDNALVIEYKATTDATTIVNVTNHSYFNLNGQDGSTIFDHKVMLNCSNFTEYTESIAQTGKIIPVENTPLDFRKEHTIGERFNDDYKQLRICTGYDHNMTVDGEA